MTLPSNERVVPCPPDLAPICTDEELLAWVKRHYFTQEELTEAERLLGATPSLQASFPKSRRRRSGFWESEGTRKPSRTWPGWARSRCATRVRRRLLTSSSPSPEANSSSCGQDGQ
jgi:hypothetical protein